MRAKTWLGVVLAIPFNLYAQQGFVLGAGTNVGRGDHVPMDFYRVSYTRDWDNTLYHYGNWRLKAHVEFSLIRLLADVDVKRKFASSTLTGIAATPVFRFSREPFANGLAPFAELGIGISYFSDSKIQSQPYWYRDYGSRFQFEDRLSFGFLYQNKYRLSLDYTHYSNFDISPPNEGLDLVSASLGIVF
ncbi:acyloxyacyl hydrolase [Aliiglaciecola sp. CAU 1673]|uniref:acyloxyacyl hydrolase n=1 Tax=Aliiglaciecola sp. CAU 1673 TaxID=3032595 RepID=UPI0023DA64FE|nr:acyloxyacyl hydrolase [Aliiglaciecola sp. CAU 1673]MDF2177626.1 acyloxyacyl hydrolase [Aliiglaciecola sp. CAU 1673]